MKALSLLFAILLMVGALTAPAALAGKSMPAAPAPTATLDCAHASSDVSLQIAITNQGPDDLPAGTTITYQYRNSVNGPLKSGSHKLAGTLKKGASISFDVMPVQDWTTPFYQCNAKVFKPITLPKAQTRN